MPPRLFALRRYATPSLPIAKARPPGRSSGPTEPRSVSLLLSSAVLGGAKYDCRRSEGDSRKTVLPKSKLDVESPLPVDTNSRPAPSTAAPDGAQIAPSRWVGTWKFASAPLGPEAGADTTQPGEVPQAPNSPPHGTSTRPVARAG